MEIFSLESVSYFYPDGRSPAVAAADLSIGEGEFVLLTGPSGGGKSTLARILAGAAPRFYGGRLEGRAAYRGEEIRSLGRKRLHGEVGIVFQDPEKQVVMSGVERELAFGCENLGIEPDEIRRRVHETAAFLNLSPILSAECAGISSGERQRVAIGSVLSMGPHVLILDEPTSQLDPVAAEEVLAAVKRLNDELGFTIILIEQRLELCFQMATRVLYMEDGRIQRDSSGESFSVWAGRERPLSIPPVARFFAAAGDGDVPVTVGRGRRFLAGRRLKGAVPMRPLPAVGDLLLRAEKLRRIYAGGVEALRGVDLSLGRGESIFLLGENGAGKSTLLRALCGLERPESGRVTVTGRDIASTGDAELARRLGYLSQNPDDYLFNDTVLEELLYTLENLGIEDEGRAAESLRLFRIEHLAGANPRDLSTGERQRVALAAVMVADPEVLLLDEPTRGLDAGLKASLGELLNKLRGRGKGIVLVTQDVEFAAEHARRVMLMFDGEIVADGSAQEVLCGGLFYSPQLARLFRGRTENVLTIGDALEAVGCRD